MRCPECVANDQRSTVYAPSAGRSTLMAGQRFYDEDGTLHDHDPNTTTYSFACSNGHSWVESEKRACPAPSCPFNANPKSGSPRA